MDMGMDDVLSVMGYRPGIRHLDVVFTNPSIDVASVPETVAPIGGSIGFRTAAAVFEVVSSSALDVAVSGVGARTILINGLDANFVEVSEIVALNGITPVLGTVLFYRVNSVEVLTAGATKTNLGNILVRDAGAGITRSMITLGQGRSEVGMYTVPAGHKMLATGWTVSARDNVGQKALADVAFYTTVDGVRSVDWRMVIDGTVPANLGAPHVFPEKADIEVVVDRVNTNLSYVTFHGHGLLVGPNTGM